MDPATGSALISGLKALHDMLKGNKNTEVMGQLLEIQSQVFDLVNENQALKAENAQQKAALAAKADTELRPDGAVWRKGDKGSHQFGGYCPNCHAESGKLLRLDISGDNGDHRSCTVCKFWVSGVRW